MVIASCGPLMTPADIKLYLTVAAHTKAQTKKMSQSQYVRKHKVHQRGKVSIQR